MTGVTYQRHSGEQTLAMLEEFVDLYDEIWSENPDERAELLSRDNFIARTNGQARKAGFEALTARSRGLLVGFSFGYPIPPGRWWSDCTPAPQEILNSSKFAVIELNVRESYRNQGIAKTLLDMLLGNRGEAVATLATIPESIANAMYKRWGWYKVGEFTDSMEALVIPIGGNSRPYVLKRQ